MCDKETKKNDNIVASLRRNQRWMVHLNSRSLLFVVITIVCAFIAGRESSWYFYLKKNYTTDSIEESFCVASYEKCVLEVDKREKKKELKNYVCKDEESSDNKQYHDDNLPLGLLRFDITNIKLEFLNSDTRLIAMMQTIMSKTNGKELLSHECIDDLTNGFSCIGVLSDSHISLRVHHSIGTESSSSDTLLTLFIHASSIKLKKVVQVIEEQVEEVNGIENEGEEIPFIQWTFTPYQQIKSGTIGGVATATSSHLPAKGQRSQNEAFNEAFVHPAMFAHYNPSRVAIVGGGDKSVATLKEVLKHKEIMSVDIYYQTKDDLSVDNTSEKDVYDDAGKDTAADADDDDEYLDCSDFVGVAQRCNDDERVEIKEEDILSWFNNHSFQGEALYDVIMMNMIPNDIENEQLIKQWYTNELFIKGLYVSLYNDGLVVFQLGQMPRTNSSPNNKTSIWKNQFLSLLETLGFKSIHIYSESHSAFSAPLTFIVAMKGENNNMLWYQTPAEKEIDIHDTIVQSHSGSAVLKHFDSAVMRKYQLPHKAFEVSHCKVKPDLCGSFNSIRNKEHVSLSNLNVKRSTIGEGSGRGLFAGVHINKGTVIGFAETRSPVYLHPSTVEYVTQYTEVADEIEAIYNYADGYGWDDVLVEGFTAYMVEPNILSFSNHGCNGTYNVIDSSARPKIINNHHLTEQNAKMSDYPPDGPIFDPYHIRHLKHLDYIEAMRDINSGEEIFSDYLFFSSASAEDFYEEVEVLKRICNGEEVGLITQNERSESSEL